MVGAIGGVLPLVARAQDAPVAYGCGRAVLSGQAANYRAAMDARDAELTDPALTDVTLTPIADAPADFMGDALTSDNLEYVLSLYADYYDKASVQLAPQEE